MTNTTETYCESCKQKLTMEDVVCPKCGGNPIILIDTLEIGLRLKITSEEPFQEYIQGDDWYRNKRKWVRKTRVINSKEDQYMEIVKDKITGEVIYECEESLSKHRGHGSAKYKKSKSNDDK